jgi:hypothetical protein
MTQILTLQEMTGQPTFYAPDPDANEFYNSGGGYLYVLVNAPTSVTVTVPATRKCAHGFYDDVEHTAEGGSRISVFGPYKPFRFNGTRGTVAFQLSSVDNVGLAAVLMPNERSW